MLKLRTFGLAATVAVMFAVSIAAGADKPDTLYYALDQNGITCGYAEVRFVDTVLEGKPVIYIEDRMELQITALGAEVIGKYHFQYWIDPATGMYTRHTSDIDQGSLKMGAVMTVVGDSIQLIGQPGDDTTIVALPPGIILQNTRIFRFLVEDFVRDGLSEVEHKVFSEIDGNINDISYILGGEEELELAGQTYRALRINFINRTMGIKVTMWVDATSGLVLKTVHPIRSTYLTDSGVKDRVKSADLDNHLFAKVGTLIPNVKSISYMKVKVACDPAGMWITPEGLNVPGQKFVGTVEDNRVEGIFEISHERYDGSDAPAFPPDFSEVDSLAEYLQPADLIESDAPELVEKARELTEGAEDSWEAMMRLSQWVSDEISYDIPGGGTALNTYKLRMGECGSHSNLLAAFCRAVGIPARVIFGCLYVPNYGGTFGQHAWNEVFMGEHGWIPVDATAEEIDYVDCGHVRLGKLESKAAVFNPDTLEILDYRVGGDAGTAAEVAAEDFTPYLGKYQGARSVLTVMVQNGSLALDIPGQMVFELNPPNDNGERFFKLTEAVCVSFEMNDSGIVTTLVIDERQRIPRGTSSDTSAVGDEVPDDYRPLVGAYALPMQNQNLIVLCQGDTLAADIPGMGVTPLEKSEADNQWTVMAAPGIKLAFTFKFENAGQASAIMLSTLSYCPRLDDSSGN
ncbi:MAG: transglutaminase domain-containing protein [Candidatus Zixiibacteriota bacterium]|nr:MAG: transglutaminase domain-containing protein [candidate division Zixibacteria bacterium]